ncbi:hypothetical protein J7Y46_002383 [Vibrio parahaemolyticus]|nr:hypothetical protein [Vibrio parahaemolyticus]
MLVIDPQSHCVKINDKQISDDFLLELIAVTPKREVHKYPAGSIIVESISVKYEGYLTVTPGTTIASEMFSLYNNGGAIKIEATPTGTNDSALYEGCLTSTAGQCRYKLTLVSNS